MKIILDRSIKFKISNKMLAIFIITAFSTATFVLPAASIGPKEDLEYAQQKYEELLKSEIRKSSKSMWLDVIKLFDKVVKYYPTSPEAPIALFAGGCIYREMFNYSITLGELYNAEKKFKKFLREYPSHELSSEAEKNIKEIEDQKKKSNLVSVSTKKPNPEEFPGREITIKKPDTKESSKKEKVSESPTLKFSTLKVAVEKIRYFSDFDHTRVVVDLDSYATYKDAVLPKDNLSGLPTRIYVDIFGVKLSPNLHPPLQVKDGLISTIRWSQSKEDTVRVVLDLESTAGYKIFSLKDPHRVVIDIMRN